MVALQSPLYESGKRDTCCWLESSVGRAAERMCEETERRRPGNLQINEPLINGALWGEIFEEDNFCCILTIIHWKCQALQ